MAGRMTNTPPGFIVTNELPKRLVNVTWGLLILTGCVPANNDWPQFLLPEVVLVTLVPPWPVQLFVASVFDQL